MIHFGDVTVERSGDTFVYKRGENSLVNWTIGGDDLNEEDYEFVDNWKSDSRSNKDNQPDRLWLSFLSTLAKQGVTFTERYENAAVSNAEKKWMEMTLFRKEFLRSECEEFLKSYCANCYYSKRVLKLLNRTSSALMTLKYGRIDPVVPKWADSSWKCVDVDSVMGW